MIFKALEQSIAQLSDPTFRLVFIRSVVTSALVLMVMLGFLHWFWPQDWTTGWDWVDEAGFVAVALIASYVMFPALATMVMSTQLELIAGAVERRYYPGRVGMASIPFIDALLSGLALLGKAVAINLIAAPVYIFLLITGGIGTVALALLINGYLLGREYYELVSLRHVGRKGLRKSRHESRGNWMLGGIIIAAIFLVPIANLFAPIVGAALMTHIYHGATPSAR